MACVRYSDASHVENRLERIVVIDTTLNDTSRGETRRETHDQRHADRRLVHVQRTRTVAFPEKPTLAQSHAMIRRINEERIVQLADLRQTPRDAFDVAVDVGDGGVVIAPAL